MIQAIGTLPAQPFGHKCRSARTRIFSDFLFRVIFTICLSSTLAVTVPSIQAAARTPTTPQAQNQPSVSVPLVLVGGTVIDVTDWGHSARDLHDAVVIIRDGHILEVGSRATVVLPKGARIIDCTGRFIIPGLVDGLAGMRTQGQANANLYMGVTTIVAASDAQRGWVYTAANPSPHLYLADSIGTTDNWNLLGRRSEWASKLQEGKNPAELSLEDTARQIVASEKMGTRVLRLGHNITAANTQWIIAHAHQMGLVTYGEFASTPYHVGIEAGVDALPRMDRYDLGVIPDELQRPLLEDPNGAAALTAYDYAERLPPTDHHLRDYARFLASHHAALMPTLSSQYLQLPNHRNLWKESAAILLDPATLSSPSDLRTGEAVYWISPWARRMPTTAIRWLEDSQRKKADQSAMRLWQINQVLFSAYPHYLTASGAPLRGTMPGISMHTELDMLTRLGLTPREALAAATNNFSIVFGWNELGQIAAGRRADVLVLDADPTENVWNIQRISVLIVDGNVLDRDGLLRLRR